MVKNILVIGADSELAKEFINSKSNKNTNFYKVSRNIKESDIEVKNYLIDSQKISEFAEKIPSCIVIFFNGFIAENRPEQYPSRNEIALTYEINFKIPYFLTQELLPLKNIKKFIYISSIAAVKPRFKNYIYGNCKSLLEESIGAIGIKNFLFLRFGKINTKMSKNHKNVVFTLETKQAAKLIYKNLKKNGIKYPNYSLKFISILLMLVPKKIINNVEKKL